MLTDKEQLDFAKWLFERTLGWISAADAKVAVVLTLDTAMLGGLAAAFATTTPPRTGWVHLTVFSAAAFISVGVFCAAMAAVPRMLGPVRSLIFFTRIAAVEGQDYVDAFRKTTEAEHLADLTLQIHRNAQIAHSKHWWVRKSLIWSFVGALPFLAAIALMVKT